MSPVSFEDWVDLVFDLLSIFSLGESWKKSSLLENEFCWFEFLKSLWLMKVILI